MWSKTLLSTVSALVLLATAATAHAQAPEDLTTADIIHRGSVNIGVLSASPPFDTVDASGNPAGYDEDIAELIGKALGVRVHLVPLNSTNRTAALLTDKVDFEVALAAPTPQRALQVMFTSPYYAFQLGVLAKNTAPIEKLSDLAGKHVAVPRGSTEDVLLSGMTIPGMTIVRFDDDADCIQALMSGQVDAAATATAEDMLVLKAHPNSGLAVKFVFSLQPNSMMVRMGDYQLLQWLNDFIYWNKVDGTLNALSLKWTGQPLPDFPPF